MAHIMKAKVSDIGKLDTEAFDEKYRAKQDRVDPSRTKDNLLIAVGDDGQARSYRPTKGAIANAVKRATEIHQETAGRKARSDAVGSVNIVIPLPQELRDYSDSKEVYPFFGHVARFLHDRYGSDFVCAAVHMDESTPHMHAYVIPMVDGKLNAKKMFDRAEFNSFHGDLQKYMDARMPGVSILTSTEEERAERRKARPGTEGKKTLAELKADTVRAEREYDDLAVCLTAKKKELDEVSRKVETQKKELSSVNKDLDNARMLLRVKEMEREDEEKELEKVRAEHEMLSEQVNVSKAKLIETREELAEVTEDYRAVNELLAECLVTFQQLIEKTAQLKKELMGPITEAINERIEKVKAALLQQTTEAEEKLNAICEAVESHTVDRSTRYDDYTM